MQPLANIQAMRGVAAGMVLLSHLFPALYWVGPAGVDIFFVISGFIISLTATGSALRFARKRIVRIFPAYWLALGAAWLIDPYVPLAPAATPAHHPLRLIFLLTAENNKLAVAWTLAYEIYFYAVVSLLLALVPRHVFPSIAVWMLLQVGVVLALPADWQWSVPFSPLIFEFGMGCAVAWLYRQERTYPTLPAGVLWFAAGTLLNRAYGDYYPLARTLCFGPAAALIIHGLVTAKWRLPRVLQRLGDVSYPVYLWHQMVIIVLKHLW